MHSVPLRIVYIFEDGDESDIALGTIDRVGHIEIGKIADGQDENVASIVAELNESDRVFVKDLSHEPGAAPHTLVKRAVLRGSPDFLDALDETARRFYSVELRYDRAALAGTPGLGDGGEAPEDALEEDEYGLGAHADTGFMTWLPPAKEEGLQILDRDGNWFWPEVEEGAIVMNLGQFLERWSNERFRATPHRVIPPTQNDRYSVACFVNPNFEKVCECLPTCHGPDNPPKYPTQTYHEFYSWYMHQTYPHYKEFAEDDDSGNQKISD